MVPCLIGNTLVKGYFSSSFRSIPGPCGEPLWTYFGGYCYCVQNIVQTWEKAKNYCNGKRAFLVDIQSSVENKFLLEYVNESISSVWIGYNDIEREGEFVWDHTSGSDMYSNWTAGHPYHLYLGSVVSVTDCVVLTTRENSIGAGGWVDIVCNKTRATVCKKGNSRVMSSFSLE